MVIVFIDVNGSHIYFMIFFSVLIINCCQKNHMLAMNKNSASMILYINLNTYLCLMAVGLHKNTHCILKFLVL